jgi:hypothetical protein
MLVKYEQINLTFVNQDPQKDVNSFAVLPLSFPTAVGFFFFTYFRTFIPSFTSVPFVQINADSPVRTKTPRFSPAQRWMANVSLIRRLLPLKPSQTFLQILQIRRPRKYHGKLAELTPFHPPSSSRGKPVKIKSREGPSQQAAKVGTAVVSPTIKAQARDGHRDGGRIHGSE